MTWQGPALATKPLRLAGTIAGMRMAETRALYNRRARKRLNRALPEIFPAPVLGHALRQRWLPAMPRLAVDGYWRSHAIRADRLARALAAQSGAPSGWTWRVGAREGLGAIRGGGNCCRIGACPTCRSSTATCTPPNARRRRSRGRGGWSKRKAFRSRERATRRQGRACPGHPRLGNKKGVDARHKAGHDV